MGLLVVAVEGCVYWQGGKHKGALWHFRDNVLLAMGAPLQVCTMLVSTVQGCLKSLFLCEQ